MPGCGGARGRRPLEATRAVTGGRRVPSCCVHNDLTL